MRAGGDLREKPPQAIWSMRRNGVPAKPQAVRGEGGAAERARRRRFKRKAAASDLEYA